MARPTRSIGVEAMACSEISMPMPQVGIRMDLSLTVMLSIDCGLASWATGAERPASAPEKLSTGRSNLSVAMLSSWAMAPSKAFASDVRSTVSLFSITPRMVAGNIRRDAGMPSRVMRPAASLGFSTSCIVEARIPYSLLPRTKMPHCSISCSKGLPCFSALVGYLVARN